MRESAVFTVHTLRHILSNCRGHTRSKGEISPNSFGDICCEPQLSYRITLAYALLIALNEHTLVYLKALMQA